MNRRIPVAGPWITRREIDYVTDAVTHSWYGQANSYNHRFEKAFADYLEVPHAISLPSCTSGIHLALAAMDIGPGDEVIVPEITWIATSAPIRYVGATPVFADVDPTTWCLSPASLESLITPRTRAVIVVDLYGNVADYDAILAITAKHGLRVIEDAAEAMGATHRKRRAGSFGDAAVFSFHGSKTLTTAEGGMLVLHDRKLLDRVNFLRDHGRKAGDVSFENSEVAFKYKMTSLQAALGLAQLERIEELIARKRQAFQWYADRLGDLPGIRLNNPGPEVEAVYWMVSPVWDEGLGFTATELQDALAAHGIDTRPFFKPLSSLPAYRHLPGMEDCPRRNPASYRLRNLGINLPSSLMLTEDDADFVCAKVREFFTANA